MNDEQLWERFAAATLPHAEWTHRLHLRVAWLFLSRYPLDEAHVLMRVGIIRLNAAHGLVETPTRGYHESITRAWLIVLGSLMKQASSQDSDYFMERHAEHLGQAALFAHYSRERLLRTEARARFVEPDLLPLPSEGGAAEIRAVGA
jgi:hypothetical protein